MTMTIEKILKSGMNNEDRHNWNYQEVISNNKSKVFIYDYPIDEVFKDDFETHFCAHFYLRDLAFQNVGEFCYYLSERLNNLFPYYNEFFKRIGNYDELFTNLGYDETISRSHDETGTYKSDTTSQTTGEDTQNVTDDNVTKGRDFPNSAIDLNSSSYYTDSSETNNVQDTQRNTETSTTGNQDDTTTNQYDETETRHYVNNNNLNVYDFLMKYRRDIDNIYGEIYMKMDDLFIGIL